MYTATETITSAISSPVRSITAKADLYNGTELTNSFTQNDRIKSLKIERTGEENKFFGFGISQKLNLHLIDKARELDITTAYKSTIFLGTGSSYMTPYPFFHVSEVHRDENTNELSITAYDKIYTAAAHTVNELTLDKSYTIQQFAEACATLIGASGIDIKGVAASETCFSTSYEAGANFDGTETIRDALDDVAEATQTIYYLDNQERLIFRRLALTGDVDLSITKADYITLTDKTARRLAKIFHVTELGDNVSASIAQTGSTQYIRNNAFWELRDDIGTLVDNALAAAGGLTISQFDLKWRGNFLLEIGDKISLITKDDNSITSFVLNDSIEYNGALSEETSWQYEDNEEETVDNPTSLGSLINQTTAKVDKANKTIELVASDVSENKSNIASLITNTQSISASVQSLKDNTEDAQKKLEDNLSVLSAKVDTQITSEDVKIQIGKELSNGVNNVTTNTGFTFNDEGLSVSKSDSEMSTTITEEGMIVYKNDEAVLTANNVGVDAANLHATTYLIIGTNSRFEDYLDTRTGCFYIGS